MEIFFKKGGPNKFVLILFKRRGEGGGVRTLDRLDPGSAPVVA